MIANYNLAAILEELMSNKIPYHLPQQYAYSLLGSICRDLAELEERTQSYLDHVDLQPEDRAAVQAAHDALMAAQGTVTGLRQSAPQPSE